MHLFAPGLEGHLISSERTLRTEHKAIIVARKKTWAGYMKVYRDAEDILNKLEDEGKDGMLEDNENHVRVNHLKVLYKWMHEKPITPGTNRPELLAVWRRSKNHEPYMRTIGAYWTEAD